jgi:hypothetical protein
MPGPFSGVNIIKSDRAGSNFGQIGNLTFFPDGEAFDRVQPKAYRMAKSETIRDQAVPLDPTVWALGAASLLNAFSSELAVRTLPLFPGQRFAENRAGGLGSHDT